MFSREDVEHISTLCRIGISEKDIESYRAQLSHILNQFEVLQELDTENIEPTASPVSLGTVMRDDEVQGSLTKEEVLQNAPVREGDYFRVKVVLEE